MFCYCCRKEEAEEAESLDRLAKANELMKVGSLCFCTPAPSNHNIYSQQSELESLCLPLEDFLEEEKKQTVRPPAPNLDVFKVR